MWTLIGAAVPVQLLEVEMQRGDGGEGAQRGAGGEAPSNTLPSLGEGFLQK